MSFRDETLDRFFVEEVLKKKYVVLKNDEQLKTHIEKYSLKNCVFQYSTYKKDENRVLQRRYYHVCEKEETY